MTVWTAILTSKAIASPFNFPLELTKQLLVVSAMFFYQKVVK